MLEVAGTDATKQHEQSQQYGKISQRCFCKLEFPPSCSAPTKHQSGCRQRQASLSSACQLAALGICTHCLPPPQLPGTFLHYETSRGSALCKTKLS